MKKLIAQIKPKQLIIVHGSREATHSLAAYCKQQGRLSLLSQMLSKIFDLAGIAPNRTFTPNIGETIDATVESHIYQVLCRYFGNEQKDIPISR